jgi:hypothetical protein
VPSELKTQEDVIAAIKRAYADAPNITDLKSKQEQDEDLDTRKVESAIQNFAGRGIRFSQKQLWARKCLARCILAASLGRDDVDVILFSSSTAITALWDAPFKHLINTGLEWWQTPGSQPWQPIVAAARRSGRRCTGPHQACCIQDGMELSSIPSWMDTRSQKGAMDLNPLIPIITGLNEWLKLHLIAPTKPVRKEEVTPQPVQIRKEEASPERVQEEDVPELAPNLLDELDKREVDPALFDPDDPFNDGLTDPYEVGLTNPSRGTLAPWGKEGNVQYGDPSREEPSVIPPPPRKKRPKGAAKLPAPGPAPPVFVDLPMKHTMSPVPEHDMFQNVFLRFPQAAACPAEWVNDLMMEKLNKFIQCCTKKTPSQLTRNFILESRKEGHQYLGRLSVPLDVDHKTDGSMVVTRRYFLLRYLFGIVYRFADMFRIFGSIVQLLQPSARVHMLPVMTPDPKDPSVARDADLQPLWRSWRSGAQVWEPGKKPFATQELFNMSTGTEMCVPHLTPQGQEANPRQRVAVPPLLAGANTDGAYSSYTALSATVAFPNVMPWTQPQWKGVQNQSAVVVWVPMLPTQTMVHHVQLHMKLMMATHDAVQLYMDNADDMPAGAPTVPLYIHTHVQNNEHKKQLVLAVMQQHSVLNRPLHMVFHQPGEVKDDNPALQWVGQWNSSPVAEMVRVHILDDADFGRRDPKDWNDRVSARFHKGGDGMLSGVHVLWVGGEPAALPGNDPFMHTWDAYVGDITTMRMTLAWPINMLMDWAEPQVLHPQHSHANLTDLLKQAAFAMTAVSEAVIPSTETAADEWNAVITPPQPATPAVPASATSAAQPAVPATPAQLHVVRTFQQNDGIWKRRERTYTKAQMVRTFQSTTDKSRLHPVAALYQRGYAWFGQDRWFGYICVCDEYTVELVTSDVLKPKEGGVTHPSTGVFQLTFQSGHTARVAREGDHVQVSGNVERPMLITWYIQMQKREEDEALGVDAEPTSEHVPIVTGNLLSYIEHSNTFIAHQCNCESLRAGGLAGVIFSKDKCPKANIPLKDRKQGGISVCGSIINLYAQVHGAGPSARDTAENRLKLFRKALAAAIQYVNDVAHEKGQRQTLALPYKIGCGIAGGNWELYLHEIQTSKSRVALETGKDVLVDLVIVQLSS